MSYTDRVVVPEWDDYEWDTDRVVVPEWDDYEWDPATGHAIFSKETEDVFGEVVDKTTVEVHAQPSRPYHEYWKVARTDIPGAKDIVGNTIGVACPLPGGPPMPQVFYGD